MKDRSQNIKIIHVLQCSDFTGPSRPLWSHYKTLMRSVNFSQWTSTVIYSSKWRIHSKGNNVLFCPVVFVIMWLYDSCWRCTRHLVCRDLRKQRITLRNLHRNETLNFTLHFCRWRELLFYRVTETFTVSWLYVGVSHAHTEHADTRRREHAACGGRGERRQKHYYRETWQNPERSSSFFNVWCF